MNCFSFLSSSRFAFMQSSWCCNLIFWYLYYVNVLYRISPITLSINWCVDQCHLIKHWPRFYFCLCSFLCILKLWRRTKFYHYTWLKWYHFSLGMLIVFDWLMPVLMFLGSNYWHAGGSGECHLGVTLTPPLPLGWIV